MESVVTSHTRRANRTDPICMLSTIMNGISGYLTHSVLLKLLQLPLKAEVGVGDGAAHPHHLESIFPGQRRDGHDVGHGHRHRAGHPGQTDNKRHQIRLTIMFQDAIFQNRFRVREWK